MAKAWRKLAAACPSGWGLYLVTLAASGAGPDGTAAPRTVALFSISKSENKNRVEYAIRTDGQCQPIGEAPIFAYWRMIEKGPTVTEPVLKHELEAYGIASEVVLSRAPEAGRVRVVLRAVRARPIVVEVFRSPTGECTALSTVSIEGAPAHLYSVYAKLKWPFGVDYLLLQGWSLDGAHLVNEKLAQ